jgi:trehalose 6-phosphate phosphatase
MKLAVTTDQGREGLAAIVALPESALMCFDYDGTLAPIVPDPASAIPHPQAVAVLRRLTGYVGTVAIVTGRPARTAVELAAFGDVCDLHSLIVLGHYGAERWDADTGRFETPDAPAGLRQARAELPGLLSSLGLADAHLEEKGLSVAVHVRNTKDPDAAFRRLQKPLQDLAGRCGLAVEPGRRVIELRSPGMDKGRAVRRLAAERAAGAVAFVGDDLGDLAAFDEVDRLRAEGVPGLLVCSGSAEEDALASRADLIVDGPEGVVRFVAAVVERLDSASRS